MLRTDELDYDLPEGLIARRPVEPRHDARLLVVSRSDDTRLQHAHVRDLPDILESTDLLVRNVSRVVPARLEGCRRETGGRVQGLYLQTISSEIDHAFWRALLKSNGRLRRGTEVVFARGDARAPGVHARLVERDDAAWIIRVENADVPAHPFSTPEALNRIGATPLPPYILGARQRDDDLISDDDDRAWYQTIYASESGGSVAAPTAGLHFSNELLQRLERDGFEFRDVILHVGEGTFKPVESESIEAHPMHSERFEVGIETLRALTRARSSGRRVIAIGTTTARTLESLPAPGEGGTSRDPISGETRILIAPGHEWRWLDGLMTNFHLPRSTLLAMVAALFPGGVDRIKEIYSEAIGREYRFYSYGDAMLILP